MRPARLPLLLLLAAPAVRAQFPAAPPAAAGSAGPAVDPPAASPPAAAVPFAPTSSPPAAATPAPSPATPARPPPPPAAQRRAQLAEEAGLAGDLRSALFGWQEAANLDPRNPDYRMKLGEAYERLGYWAQAAREFDLAAALDPPGEAARRRAERARAARDGKAPPAEPAKAASSAETPAAPAYEAGVALMAQGQYAAAVTSLDEAIRLDSRLAVAYSARAGSLFGLGRYLDSAGDYRTAMALDPGPATPLFGMAECQRLLGQAAAAAEYYRRYLASSAADARDDLRAEARRRLGEAPAP